MSVVGWLVYILATSTSSQYHLRIYGWVGKCKRREILNRLEVSIAIVSSHIGQKNAITYSGRCLLV